MGRLHLREVHVFERLGRSMLFDVDTMLAYEISPLLRDIVAALQATHDGNPLRALRRHYRRSEIREAIAYLENEGIIHDPPSPASPRTHSRGPGPLRHLELMVTHACNMACRYCYGAHGQPDWTDASHLYGATESAMSFETARRGIDFLFASSASYPTLSVIFFGGEPLAAFPLIRKLVPYIRAAQVAAGKRVNLSLSTNGSLLTPEITAFLLENRISCQISIDGAPPVQNANRALRSGRDSYDGVVAGSKSLLRARRGCIPARATLAHGAIDVAGTVEHLLRLGFGSVHVEPCLGEPEGAAVTAEDIDGIEREQEELARRLVGSVREGRRYPYTNLVRMVRRTRVVRERASHYCGAARSYLTLAQDGVFYPCHRFVGMPDYRMGDLDSGLDETLRRRMSELHVDARPHCRDCWARHLCGGGCWKHAVDANGCLEQPDRDGSCRIMRHTVECALAVNAELDVDDEEVLQAISEPAPLPVGGVSP